MLKYAYWACLVSAIALLTAGCQPESSGANDANVDSGDSDQTSLTWDEEAWDEAKWQ